jgi:hypothetical protein
LARATSPDARAARIALDEIGASPGSAETAGTMIVRRFDERLAGTSARDFVEGWLRDGLGLSGVVIGHDCTDRARRDRRIAGIGRDRGDDAAGQAGLGAEFGERPRRTLASAAGAKEIVFARLGLDGLIVRRFDERLAGTSARDFVEGWLEHRLVGGEEGARMRLEGQHGGGV